MSEDLSPEVPPVEPPPRWWQAAYWLLPAIAYAGLIFYLSSQPNPLPVLTSRLSDKLLHLVEYAAFAATVTWGLSHVGLEIGRASCRERVCLGV